MKWLENDTLTKVLIIDFLLLLAFTIAIMIIFCIKGAIPDTLVASFFTCFGAENGFMALITIAKNLRKGDE